MNHPSMLRDSNWSQIRETLSMLYLSAAQIESSMREGTEAVHQLTNALVSISDSSKQIDISISNSASTDLAEVRRSNDEIAERIKETVIACQFHDRISQRLEHVTNALSSVCDLISTPESYDDPDSWRNLQDNICAGYTMEAEKIMFEHIMMGMSVEEALEIYHHKFDDEDVQEESNDEIELF